MKKTWTDAQLNMIGAQAIRFPDNQTLHWTAIRETPNRIRELMRDLNTEMTAVEGNPDLSVDGVNRMRAQAAKEALSKLEKVTEPAEREATKRVEKLQEKSNAFLEQGKAEPHIAVEIRSHLAKQKSPIMAALKQKNDPRVISAVIEAPAFLSGMTEEEASTLRANALAGTEQHKEVIEITKAIEVCRNAVKSAAAMIGVRAKMRKRHGGEWELN